MIIPIPTDEPPEQVPVITMDSRTDDWYRWYLNVPSWKCSKCALTNFGRNKCCASCRGEKQ